MKVEIILIKSKVNDAEKSRGINTSAKYRGEKHKLKINYVLKKEADRPKYVKR